MKKQKSKRPFQSFLKILLCAVLAIGLFTGGRVLGQGIASGEITLSSLSVSSLASLPVFSMFFEGDKEQQEEEAL